MDYEKELALSAVCVLFMLIIFAGFIIKANQTDKHIVNDEIKTETQSVVAINCTYKANENCYEVTIRDRNGNDWAYYDSEYVPKETKLEAIMTDGRIVDVRR